MKNKLTYVGVIIIGLVLIGALGIGVKNLTGKSVEDIKRNVDDVKENVNPELEQYKEGSIPEECRLPDYEDDVESWKEHLSHHENTLYCLDYYKELEGGK